jgi:hypothetical protein
MQKFSTTDAAFAGFRMVREHPRTVAVWGTVLMVLSAVTTIILIAVGGAELQAFFDFDPSSAPDAEKMAEQMLKVLPILMLSGAFNLATSAILLTGVYRMVLRPMDPAPYYLRLGADEFRQFCAQLLYTLAVIGVYIGSAMLVGAVVTILQKILGDNPLLGLFALLGLVGIFGVTIYAAVRLSFAGVATFVGGRITLRGSLPITKGRFLPLLGAYLLAFVLFVVVYLAILLLGTAVAMRRADRDDLAAAVAAFGPEIQQPVGGLDDLEIVLDHHHGVALVDQLVEHFQQLLDVVEVQAGGRLVEDVERAAGGALATAPWTA